MKPGRIRVALAATAITCAMTTSLEVAAAGDVYKWVDENGKVHFGDKPEHADAETIEVKPSAPATTGARQRHERTQKVLDAMTTERKEREQAREASQQEALERKRKCGISREELHRRETSARLFFRDEKGNKRVIEGDEYEAVIQEARDAVAKWCR